MQDRDALYGETSYNAAGKSAFLAVSRKLLNRLKKELEPVYGRGEVRVNKAGIAVSGEVTLHLDKVYIQAGQFAFSEPKLLVRHCDGLKDYTGGQNQYLPLHALIDTQQCARDIKRLVRV